MKKNNLNDILKDLETNIDLSNTFKVNKINAWKKNPNNTNDLKKNDLQDIDIWNKNFIEAVIINNSNQVSKEKEQKFILKNLKERINKLLILKKYQLFINYFKKIYINTNKKLKKNYYDFINKIKLTKKIIPTIKKQKLKKIKFYRSNDLLWNKLLFTKRFFLYTTLIFCFFIWLLYINKIIIEKKINSWYERLLSIKNNSWDFNFIKEQLQLAKSDFSNWSLLFIPFWLFAFNNDVNNWYYILKWWNELTYLLEKWLNIYLWIIDFISKNWWPENIKITNLLYNLKWEFNQIVSSLYKTIVYYQKINNLLNNNLENKLEYAKWKLKEIYSFIDIINKDYDIFLRMLWHNTEKNYLILFQNNDEIRATWGFIWSLANFTIRNWKVININKEDVYSYEWDMNKVITKKEPAPEWLNKITETFWFRDSNYYLSFESSSNNIKSFLDKIDRPEIDWIIYMNQNTILDFLKYIGWIKFDELNETITEENFSLIISTLVEAKVFKEWVIWTPKQILFDFANIFINVLKEKKDYYTYLDIILENIKSRDLVLYSFHPEENNLLWKLWVNWKINFSETLDFAYPVYTSIWWNKSDRYIEIKYKKDIIENSDCSIDTNLSINRIHMFSKFEEEKVNKLLNYYNVIDKQDIINIQWKGDNKSYVRILLPKEAIIEPTEWMNIEEFDTFKKIDYYQNTRVLESTNFNIKYKLPNKDCKNYNFKLYKQPWIREYWIEINKKNEQIKKIWINNDFEYNIKK